MKPVSMPEEEHHQTSPKPVRHRKKKIDDGSQLGLVENKELEIRGKILEAKKEAEAIIAEAQQQADELRAQAEKLGHAKAEKSFTRETKKIEAEAARISKSTANKLEQGSQNLEKAVGLIIEKVLGF